jgi:hypothetical protein
MAEIPKKSRVNRGDKPQQKNRKGWKKNPRNPDGTESKDEEELNEDEQCIICANKIHYASIPPCNHTTCHMCTFRHRALYGKTLCLVCRSDNERVIFSEQIEKVYTDFGANDIVKSHLKYNIDFTAEYVYNDTLGLLDYKCYVSGCHETFLGFKALSEHVKAEHNKFYCLICSKNKKAFLCELTLYTYKQLQRHQSEGDEEGFDGHPECKHCRGLRFYSEDELNIHIRDKHERCHICDQVTPKTADYYKNYDDLYTHFRMDHYVCTVPSCLDKKFIVFREDLELTSHMLKEHGGLTGSNGKVIVGSSNNQFQSLLSTFNGSVGAPSTTGQSRRRNRNNNDSNEEVDSYDTKKMRLEERAKHYLHYNTSSINEFLKINTAYKSGNITAKDVLKEYQTLFDKRDKSELSMLIYELSEIFPKNSEQHKNLKSISNELHIASEAEQYPVLGGYSSPSSTASIHSWGNSNRKVGADNFPTLSKPKKATSSQVNANQPIRYTKVLKKAGNKTSPLTINQGADPNYKPNYLSNLKDKNSSASSLPSLGQSRSHLPNPMLARSNANSASTLSLSESKFPALEKKSTKKVFPRVKLVNVDSTQWGTSSTPQSPESEDVFEELITDKRKQKLKKKQDKLLFKT